MYSHLQKDLHNVIARLAKSAEAISQMSMRLPRFARNDGQNSILVYVVNYSCPIYFTLQNLWILRGAGFPTKSSIWLGENLLGDKSLMNQATTKVWG
jgi:hypothetical protein